MKAFVKDIRIEKMIIIALIMDHYNYENNKDVHRRINNYDFQINTIITHNDEYIKISTETSIKGVHDVLFLFSNGTSKEDFEFN